MCEMFQNTEYTCYDFQIFFIKDFRNYQPTLRSAWWNTSGPADQG